MRRRVIKIVAISSWLFLLAWQHIQATRLGYEVERSRRQLQGLRSRTGGLKMQLESTLSPAQLAQEARTRHGMSPASPQFMRILDGSEGSRSQHPLARQGMWFLGRWFPKTWRVQTT